MPSPRSRRPSYAPRSSRSAAAVVALHRLDARGEDVGLEEPVRDAELLDHLARRRDHASRRVGAAAQRFEHALARERDGLDGRRALRDAQHAHHVEAAAAGARHRARAPERGERCAGQHRVRAAAIAGAARRGERLVERRLARAHLAEPRERLRVHRVRLRLAGGVAQPGELLRRFGDGVGGGLQFLRRRQHRELAREAGLPRAQAIVVCGEAIERGDRGSCGADVAGREQRLAPVEREIGAGGIVRVEPTDRAAEQARRERHVVARERAAACGREAHGGARAETPRVRVERSEFAQERVRLLEMPADRLVVLGRVADLRLDPVCDRRVQLGARALQQAPVRRVADQHVMEAQHRLAEQPAGVALDQLAAAQRFEARVEIAGLARQQRRDGAAREVAPDDGGAFEHRALLGPQPLDARGEQRVDRRRHLERRRDSRRPSSDRPPW